MPLKATGRSLLIRILVRLCILARFEDLSAQIRVFVAGETTMTEAFAIQMSWLETKGKTRVIPMSTAHLRATRIADGCITLPPSFRFLPLSLSYSLLGAIVESRFESRYPRQQPGVKRARLGFTLGGRWTSVETASALLLRSTLTTADALRRKWGGFRAMETLASLDYRGGARLRDDDGMNRCECVSLCRRRVAWEW